MVPFTGQQNRNFVPYEISLKEAINKGMLAPFHYYGGYDGTDYSGLRLTRGKYEEQELTELYMQNAARYDLIYKYYMKYRSQRALGFCCSRGYPRYILGRFVCHNIIIR